MTIITARDKGFAWHHRGHIHVKGYLFDAAETFLRDASALDYFATVADAGSLRDKLCEANGCFAVIVETDGHILAAVDSVRSIPLFYTIKNQELMLSDDVSEIHEQIGGCTIDPIAREEFLRVGYTVGPSTLDPRIKQIEAGDLLVFDTASSQIKMSTYFSHAHGDYTDKSVEVLVGELDQITSRWARRLIRSAEGRTIVVPLSGGYDSRSIVCALKREGYPKVVCYSYGVLASYEHQVASKVSTQLAYPIHVIEYNRQCWQTVLESPRFPQYCRFASQRCSVPHIQDVPAFEMLVERGNIPADSIVVPGFCGDLQGGSYVPPVMSEHLAKKVLSEGIDRYLLGTLFDLLTAPVEPKTEQALLSRINAFTRAFKADDIQEFCSVLENWFIRHKVARFVVNAVRVYEWYGHEWRLPLWDNELIEWWYRIPLCHRVNSRLYHRFLFERLFNPMKVAFRKPRPPVCLTHLADRWLPAALIPPVKFIYKRVLTRPISGVRPKPVDIDAFNDASLLLLQQCHRGQNLSDFGNINGVLAAWCDVFITDRPANSDS